MSKKKHEDHEEHVNHEAWVIPYADLLTLLMGLFLVLWSLGKTDETRAEQVRAGFAAELGIGPSGQSLGVGGTGSAAQETTLEDVKKLEAKVSTAEAIRRQADLRETRIQTERAQLEEARQQIQAQLEAKGLADQVETRLTPEGLIVVATEGLLFGSGSATLGEPGARAIDLIAEPMRALTQPIRIEGHTDSTPIASAAFPSNWELSTARASTVLRHLIDRFGFPATRLSAAGYADTQPVADNATPEGRAENRRVEILLVAVESTQPLETGSPSSTGADGSPVPAPMGDGGPLGVPLEIGPPLPTPTTTPAAGGH